METDRVPDRSVGVAVATFNSSAVIERCLTAFRRRDFIVVVYDDGSSDGTAEIARAVLPSVEVLYGDGTAWWAGGTRAATRRCLERGCDFVVLLNPDVFLTANDVDVLVAYAAANADLIAAAVVVSDSNESIVAWAGSHFGRVWSIPPVYSSRYAHRAGTPVASIGTVPYAVDEVHGRGVVLSRSVLAKVGELDAETFPHYGADNDFAWRAREHGVEIHILPGVRARLVSATTGQPEWAGLTLRQRGAALVAYLVRRKNGAAIPTLWKLYRRHVPAIAVVPSMLLHMALTISGRMGWRRRTASGHRPC